MILLHEETLDLEKFSSPDCSHNISACDPCSPEFAKALFEILLVPLSEFIPFSVSAGKVEPLGLYEGIVIMA